MIAERIRDLLKRARSGDAAAKAEILSLYRPQLRRLAQAELGHREPGGNNPSDVAQVTLQTMAQHFEDFRGDSVEEFDAWARRIEERALLQIVRDAQRIKRDVRATVPLENSVAPELPSGAPSTSHQVFRRQQWMRVLEALAKLPRAQQEAVRLRHLEDNSLAEIAEQMNRPETAVASLIRHGLAALRRTLKLASDGEVVVRIETMRSASRDLPDDEG